MNLGKERRRYPRYTLEPMYTPVAVRPLDHDTFDIEGHAYDISAGGMRFELDRAVKPGTTVAIQISLPSMQREDVGPGRSVFVFANIVWIDDEDEPGPVRTAAVFTHFARAGDRDRLLRHVVTGQYRLAA
ncbi:MAG: PilZ domain-containing protein [Phycisphaerae bacterium]|nr:PilZ domain-containing protein [Phycisphaerae bacterium]